MSQKCCLIQKCPSEHQHPNKMLTNTLYRCGRLLDGRPLCVLCILRLEDLVRPCYTESEVYHQKEFTKRFPDLWAVVQEVGIDLVRRELSMQRIECEPSNLPTRPEDVEGYPKLTVNIDGTRGGYYGT